MFWGGGVGEPEVSRAAELGSPGVALGFSFIVIGVWADGSCFGDVLSLSDMLTFQYVAGQVDCGFTDGSE